MGHSTAVDIGVPWTPILTGDLLSSAISTIDGLRSALIAPDLVPDNNPSLASGTAGLALFFAFLAETKPELDPRSADYAVGFLEQSITALTTQTLLPRFYGGFPGIAWTLEHLQGRLLERDEEDPNEPIDEALNALLDHDPWRGDYDLISGLAGHGVYALTRPDSPGRRALLTTILRHLEASAIVTPDGLTWFTPPHLLPELQRERNPDGFYNLGLAHGMPGVLALLGQIFAENIEPDQARRLLTGGVNWLLSHEDRSSHQAGFPTMLSADGHSTDRNPSRIAWCYGDLGIGAALLWAARSVGETTWEREAIRIATRAAERPLSESGVKDAGLCHGAAGNGHLFNRLYQATRDDVFLDASRRYFEQALGFRKPGHGVAGFQSWGGPDGGRWRNEPGLLEGAAGIGLALLTAVSSVEPDWDRMLLVSVPPR